MQTKLNIEPVHVIPLSRKRQPARQTKAQLYLGLSYIQSALHKGCLHARLLPNHFFLTHQAKQTIPHKRRLLFAKLSLLQDSYSYQAEGLLEKHLFHRFVATIARPCFYH